MALLPPLDRIPQDVAAAADYEAYSRPRLDDNAWAYIAGGAADELTLRWNREAFDRLRVNGRVLADLAGGNTRLELLGQSFEHPILIAPVAYQKLAHPGGELATAAAAAALGAGMVVSTLASTRLEEIAAASDAPLWFQLYIQHDRGFTRELIARTEAAGYRALVVTVDAPINGVRNREQRARFQLPPGVEAVNLHGMARAAMPKVAPPQSMIFDGLLAGAPTWKDLEWIQAATRLPVLVKGVMTADDALRVADMGLAGAVISNHGGRTLDTLPATIEVLPEIAERVGGRIPLLVDGGIRRGTDVLKALALGASAVMVGRAWLHALAAAGPLGVAHVLRLLRDELEVAMALTGCRRIADIAPQVVRAAPGR